MRDCPPYGLRGRVHLVKMLGVYREEVNAYWALQMTPSLAKPLRNSSSLPFVWCGCFFCRFVFLLCRFSNRAERVFAERFCVERLCVDLEECSQRKIQHSESHSDCQPHKSADQQHFHGWDPVYPISA